MHHPNSSTIHRALAIIVAICAVTLAGCSDGSDDDTAGRITVVTAFYPLEEIARNVGGDLVKVDDLTGPGQEPHDLELKASGRNAINRASVVLYLGKGFQPQVQKAVEDAPSTVQKLDLLEKVKLLPVDPQLAGTQGEVDGETLEGDADPHVWLDPTRMIAMVEAITETLSSADAAHAPTYRKNADAYLTGLNGLDAEYRAGLSSCQSRVIVTSHRAFGYLANSYGLRQIPIAGISPEEEPDPKTLQAIAAEARKEGVTTIYLESIAPPQLAKTVANEIGAKVDLLDPIEGLTKDQRSKGQTYATIMRENLTRLVTGLGCTK